MDQAVPERRLGPTNPPADDRAAQGRAGGAADEPGGSVHVVAARRRARRSIMARLRLVASLALYICHDLSACAHASPMVANSSAPLILARRSTCARASRLSVSEQTALVCGVCAVLLTRAAAVVSTPRKQFRADSSDRQCYVVERCRTRSGPAAASAAPLSGAREVGDESFDESSAMPIAGPQISCRLPAFNIRAPRVGLSLSAARTSERLVGLRFLPCAGARTYACYGCVLSVSSCSSIASAPAPRSTRITSAKPSRLRRATTRRRRPLLPWVSRSSTAARHRRLKHVLRGSATLRSWV